MTREPQTPAEWQDAVNAADYALRLDAAFQYGLLERRDGAGKKLKGSGVDVDRAQRLLMQGKVGIFPDPIE